MEVICLNDIELHLVRKAVEMAICYFSKISLRGSHSKSSLFEEITEKKKGGMTVTHLPTHLSLVVKLRLVWNVFPVAQRVQLFVRDSVSIFC